MFEALDEAHRQRDVFLVNIQASWLLERDSLDLSSELPNCSWITGKLEGTTIISRRFQHSPFRRKSH